MTKAAPSAFSLVEVTLALGVASFCLVALFGLFATGLSARRQSSEQGAAVGLLSGIAADMQSATNGASSSPRYGIGLGTGAQTLYLADDGTRVGTPAAARYRVDVVAPEGPTGRMASWFVLRATWPAGAPSTNGAGAAGSAAVFLSLDRN